MQPVTIQLLGAMRIVLPDGTALNELGPQTGALVARLALEPGRAFTREELIDFLWPDDEVEEGRRKLRQLVYRLRQQLEQAGYSGADLLISTRTTVQIDSAVAVVDARRFAALVQAAEQTADPRERACRYVEAVLAWAGELLPGFYQDLFLSERDRYAGLMYGALHALAETYAQLGQLDQAIAAATRAVQQNRSAEEAHRLLMRLYAAAGKPSLARAQYRELERALREELDVEPSPATRTLLAELQEADRTAPQPAPPTAPAMPQERTPPPARPSPRAPSRRLAHAVAVVTVMVAGWLAFGRGQGAQTLPAPAGAVAAAQPHLLRRWQYLPPPGYRDSEPTGVAADAAGNVYVCGFVQTPVHDVDFLLVKLDPNLNRCWEKTYNGAGDDVDRATSLAIDAGGSVYVAGDSFGRSGCGHENLSELDYAVVKWSAQGDRLWERRYNGDANGKDWPLKLVLDRAGGVYVTGRSWGGRAARFDIATVKYDSAGHRLWVRRWGRRGCDEAATDIAVDTAGRLWVAGSSEQGGNRLGRSVLLCYDAAGHLLRQDLLPRAPDTIEGAPEPLVAACPQGGVWVLSEQPSTEGRGSTAHIDRLDAAGHVLSSHTLPSLTFAYSRPRHLGVDSAGRAYAVLECDRAAAGCPPASLAACCDPERGITWVHDPSTDGAGLAVLTGATGLLGHVVVGGTVRAAPGSHGASRDRGGVLQYGPGGPLDWSATYDDPDEGASGVGCVTMAGSVIVAGQRTAGVTHDIFVAKYSHWPRMR